MSKDYSKQFHDFSKEAVRLQSGQAAANLKKSMRELSGDLSDAEDWPNFVELNELRIEIGEMLNDTQLQKFGYRAVDKALLGQVRLGNKPWSDLEAFGERQIEFGKRIGDIESQEYGYGLSLIHI